MKGETKNMCVIVTKEMNRKMPSKETLKKCFLANPDGCGFMYNYDNHVYIEKGFMFFDEFYSRICELDSQINLKKCAIVFHFRISTSGKIDEGNCHPYPICDDIKFMRSTFLQCKDVAYCHNGVIRDYAPKDKLMNDTQMFGMHVLNKFYKINHEFYRDKDIMKMISLLCKSKLCFLNSNGEIFYVGNFFTYKGNQFSNLYFANFKKRYYFFDDLYEMGRV